MTGGTRVCIIFLMIDKPVFREYSASRTCGTREGLDGGHVSLYHLVMAEEKVFFGTILAVGDHGGDRRIGILFVSLNEEGHFMSVVNNAGSHLHGGDYFMKSIE